MEGLVKGDVVVMTFPFSDLTGVKRRPAVVLAPLEKDVILCQITSKPKDKHGIPLTTTEFKNGSLSRDSVIRPNKLFTGSRTVITRKAGTLSQRKLKEVIDAVRNIITN